MATRVCLVGRRQLFRAGLSHLLDNEQFEIATEIGALSEIQEVGWTSGLFIVDKPHRIETIEGDIRRLKAIGAGHKLVVLATALDADEMAVSFAAGADGYLLEAISPLALNESLRLVMMGEYVFPSQLVELLRQRMLAPRGTSNDGTLSPREAEIVARLAGGMPNKVIASELTITEATVKVHLKSILKKLGVANRTQVAVWAINNGIVHPG